MKRSHTKLIPRLLLTLSIVAVALAGCGDLSESDTHTGTGIGTRTEAVIVGDFCNGTADCPLGQECLFNHCVNDPAGTGLCFSDADCPVGESCIAKRCQPDGNPGFGCTSDADCGQAWLQCVNGSCQLKPGRCTNGVGCDCGYACNASHYCVPGPSYCNSDADCGPGDACQIHCCKPKFCNSNSACPWAGYFCPFSTGSCGGTSTCRAVPTTCGSIDTQGYTRFPVGVTEAVIGCNNLYYKSEDAAHCNSVSVKEQVDCHACTAGSTRCQGDKRQVCQTNAAGCRTWRTEQVCPGYCQYGVCKVCRNECDYVGQLVCGGDDVLKKCVEDNNGHGCLELQTKQVCAYACESGACTNTPTYYTLNAHFSRDYSCFYSICYDYAKLGEGVCTSRGRVAKTTKIENLNSYSVDIAYGSVAADYFRPNQTRTYPDIPLAGTWGIWPYGCTLSGAGACPQTLAARYTYWCKRK